LACLEIPNSKFQTKRCPSDLFFKENVARQESQFSREGIYNAVKSTKDHEEEKCQGRGSEETEKRGNEEDRRSEGKSFVITT
jgi:hypothetical protein